MREAVALLGGTAQIGGERHRCSVEAVGAYAEAGADYISVGALTHSARVLDIGLDVVGDLTMLLAIDAGNTQTVVGLFDDAELVDHWRIATVSERTSDELALMIQQFLGFHGFSFDDNITGVSISSGVPMVTAALREMTERYFGFPALVIEPGIRTGMPILYDNPKEVGADRIANAVGAFDLYGGPSIVVDFGTATTIEAVSAKGEYLGGAIFPGIEISLDALVRSRGGAAAHRAGRAEARHREVDGRVDPVGRDLRLLGSGRRVGRSIPSPSWESAP